jgi:hypothetical protein
MLVGPLRGVWKAKVGKCRILYEINEQDRTVIFHDVELRKRVYKKIKRFVHSDFEFLQPGHDIIIPPELI